MSTSPRSDIGLYGIMPLWVAASVSPNAVKVYAIFAAKYADRKSGEGFPKRRTWAEDCGFSRDTLDRSIKELEVIGALTKEQQRSPDGDPGENLYTIHFAAPVRQGMGTGAAGYGHGCGQGMGTGAATGMGTGAAVPIYQTQLDQTQEDASAPAHPFAFMYADKYRRRNAGRPVPPTDHANALALAREYGDDTCIAVANDYDWQKTPNYYRPILEERRNGRTPPARNVSNGRPRSTGTGDDLVKAWERYAAGES